jgi:dTDP-4-amino-4,6-dideoxygalactose transaminase
MSRWPRHGEAERKRLHELIDSNQFYHELPLFEKEWQDYTKASFVKAHMNGSSALTSMYFALDLPPGSEVMVPSYTFVTACLSLRGTRWWRKTSRR